MKDHKSDNLFMTDLNNLLMIMKMEALAHHQEWEIWFRQATIGKESQQNMPLSEVHIKVP